MTLLPRHGIAEDQSRSDTFAWGTREAPILTGEGPLDSSSIERWCDRSSDDIRYVTAGISPKGYEKCGEPQTVAYCDALGNKFYGTSKSVAPHGYLDCSTGPRIVMERDGMRVNVNAALRGVTELNQPEPEVQEQHWIDSYYSQSEEQENSAPSSTLQSATSEPLRSDRSRSGKTPAADQASDPLALHSTVSKMLQHVGGVEGLLKVISSEAPQPENLEQVLRHLQIDPRQIEQDILKHIDELEQFNRQP